jgi:hypothetical protein
MNLSQRNLGLVKIDIERDTKAGLAIVDQLIAIAVDRALNENVAIFPMIVNIHKVAVGRNRNGAAALLFRTDKPWAVPNVAGASNYQRVFPLATRDGVRIIITCGGDLDPSAYSWPSKFEAEQLPELPGAALGKKIIEAAFALGLTWTSLVDFERTEAERRAALPVPTESPEEMAERIMAERDARTVEQYKGESGLTADSWLAAARYRLATWRAKQKQAAEA